jgi:hypothetical protein
MCGLNNHNAYNYRREPLWNLGPELCAAQVPNQSFFFIDEHIDQKVLRERASTAIITVTRGKMTAKQLEVEFGNIIDSVTWRWSAKKVTENKFVMRFPSAKMVQEYSKFNLSIKSVDAQISIETWSSSVGAEGKLEQAWFKVRGIPIDQRGVRTIAKVGGLVAKSVEIDENTRYNPEFVRIKIACRDLMEIPESAEGNLGMYIYDFYFEREEPNPLHKEKQKESFRVSDPGCQPSPKKMKTQHEKKDDTAKKNQEGGSVRGGDEWGRKQADGRHAQSTPG